jgi:hypothetical protein
MITGMRMAEGQMSIDTEVNAIYSHLDAGTIRQLRGLRMLVDAK